MKNIAVPSFEMPNPKEVMLQRLKPEYYLKRLEQQGWLEYKEAYETVLEISKAIQKAGGRSLLVGGSVRDRVFDKISKDYDLEIYGLDEKTIEKVISPFGKVEKVGEFFGVLKVFLDNGLDIDVAMPRTEQSTGAGHKDFTVKTHKELGYEEACRRRDFTMNAMMADPLTGELVDPFNGFDDLLHRRLKVTDEETFKEDPLRVLRALQFVSRFNLTVEPQSAEVLTKMAPELKNISKERILEEWKKLLLKGNKPSMGMRYGLSLGIYEQIHPELVALAGIEQNPDWHPEGDVWEHTLMTVDEAAKIVKQNKLNEEDSLTIMFAALCHDFGKVSTTSKNEKGKIVALGHEDAGVEPTKKFLKGFKGLENKIIDKVLKLVAEHMRPSLLYKQSQIGNVGEGAIKKLGKDVAPATITELVMVAKADKLGRGFEYEKYEAGEWLLEKAESLKIEAKKPEDIIKGREFLEFYNCPGGPLIGRLIKAANLLNEYLNSNKESIFKSLKDTKSPDEGAEILEKMVIKVLVEKVGELTKDWHPKQEIKEKEPRKIIEFLENKIRKLEEYDQE